MLLVAKIQEGPNIDFKSDPVPVIGKADCKKKLLDQSMTGGMQRWRVASMSGSQVVQCDKAISHMFSALVCFWSFKVRNGQRGQVQKGDVFTGVPTEIQHSMGSHNLIAGGMIDRWEPKLVWMLPVKSNSSGFQAAPWYSQPIPGITAFWGLPTHSPTWSVFFPAGRCYDMENPCHYQNLMMFNILATDLFPSGA